MGVTGLRSLAAPARGRAPPASARKNQCRPSFTEEPQQGAMRPPSCQLLTYHQIHACLLAPHSTTSSYYAVRDKAR
ncbi:hypothetical protein M3J09_009454 [Ascochyta lentis]